MTLTVSSSLFLVMLGGRSNSSNIELHDIRWVVAREIEETFCELRKQWIGSIRGLHIDSYKKIEYIDGYRIEPRKVSSDYEEIRKKDTNYKGGNSLWFINLGGYDPKEMSEKHRFGLFVAETSKEAKRKAKSSWNEKLMCKHNDNFSSVKNIKSIDDCHEIKGINGWEILLTPDPKGRHQQLIPDWYGYKRIDKV